MDRTFLTSCVRMFAALLSGIAIFAFAAAPAGAATPVFTTLPSFSAITNGANTEGANPFAGLTQGPDGTPITTTIPSGATTGFVAVITPGGEARSTTNFAVTP